MKEKIKQWRELTDEVVDQFLRDYFDDNAPYWDWVSVGGVFNYGDYWLDFQIVLDCYRLGVTDIQLLNWYDSSIEQQHYLSLEDYIKSPEKRKQQEEKHLKELRQRVVDAEETLKKAMEEYGDTSRTK